MICLFTSARGIAEEAWTVPDAAPPIQFRFPAVVEFDRSKSAALMPTSRDLVAVAVVMPGAAVQVGDVLVAFSSRIPQARAQASALNLVEAEREAARRELEIERDRQNLLAEQAGLEQDLRVATANLASARMVDQEQLRVLAAEVDLAEAELLASRRSLALAQGRHAAGTLEVDALRAAQRSVDRAIAAREAKQLARDRATQAADALTVQRRAALVESLGAKLGIDKDGKPDPAAGIRGRIAAQEASQKRERRQTSDRRDEAQRDLHLQERDGWDHCPVQTIAIAGAKNLRVAFAPGDSALAEGSQRAGVETFSAERGWGWSSGSPTLLTRAGKQPGPTLALVRGRAVWSAGLPNGSYTVTITLGDNVDWDGPVVHLSSGGVRHGIFAARRLDPRQVVTASGTIVVSDERLDVEFGDECSKAMRAPVAGIALPREHIKAGWKPGWMQDPTVFVVGANALRLRARVHQTLAMLLGPAVVGSAGDSADAVARLRAASAVDRTAFVSAGGIQGVAVVAANSTRPEPFSLRGDDDPRNALDRISNEVLFAPAAVEAAALRLGEAVEMIATLTPPAGASVVPAHLVAVAGNCSYVQEVGGAPRAVSALRVGDFWVVAETLAAGTRLVPPHLAADAAGPRSVPGEVIAGAAVPVMGSSYGRIASLIEEGSEVKAGDVVATLYNPWMEERREDSERQKAKARENYRNAAETRRIANERAAVAQREQASGEQLARIDVGLAALDDPLSLLQAEQAATTAMQEANDAAATLLRAEAQAAIDPLRLAGARSAAASAALQARQAGLKLAKARRSADWFASLSAEGAWRDAANEVAGRESDLRLARANEQVSALQSELSLQKAMQGRNWEQSFLKGREIKAPAAGRIFYRNGNDENTGRSAKFEKDFWAWRGMTIADVLDMNRLAFSAEIPEDSLMRLRAGATVELVFTQFNHRRISGTISELGRALLAPRDSDDQTDFATPVERRRLIPVTIEFTPPADLRERMVPGTKGTLVLP